MTERIVILLNVFFGTVIIIITITLKTTSSLKHQISTMILRPTPFILQFSWHLLGNLFLHGIWLILTRRLTRSKAPKAAYSRFFFTLIAKTDFLKGYEKQYLTGRKTGMKKQMSSDEKFSKKCFLKISNYNNQ